MQGRPHPVTAGLVLATGVGYAGEDDRAAKKAELDASCEAASEAKLAPLRAQYTEECVAAHNHRLGRE